MNTPEQDRLQRIASTSRKLVEKWPEVRGELYPATSADLEIFDGLMVWLRLDLEKLPPADLAPVSPGAAQYEAGREAHIASRQCIANAANLASIHPTDMEEVTRLREEARKLSAKARDLGFYGYTQS